MSNDLDEKKADAIERAGLPRYVTVYVHQVGAYGPVAIFAKQYTHEVSKAALARYEKMLTSIRPHIAALAKYKIDVHLPSSPRGRDIRPFTAKEITAIRGACTRAGLVRGEDWNGEGSRTFSVTVWWPKESKS